MISKFESDLGRTKAQLIEVGTDLVETNKAILFALQDCNNTTLLNAKERLSKSISRLSDIDAEIVHILGVYSPEAKDLRCVVSYLKITNELSRTFFNTQKLISSLLDICDCVDIQTIQDYSVPIQSSTLKALELAIAMIGIDETSDELEELYHDILIEENKTNDLYEVTERELSLKNRDEKTFTQFHKILKTLRRSSKITSRAISIANLLVYARVGGNITNQ